MDENRKEEHGELKDKGSKKSVVREFIIEWVKVIGLAIVLVWVIKTLLYTFVLVDGSSMYPNLEDKDKVVVNIIGTTLTGLDRFDVVVFEQTEGIYYIKRVIGVEGDTIEYKEDVLYVNGKKVEEPYLDEEKANLNGGGNLTEDFKLDELLGEIKVPKDSYFVLGDNRRNSKDSRYAEVGFVKKEQVMGKASLRVYPFKKIGVIK